VYKRQQRLRTIGRSAATPGLPLITALGRDPEPLRGALIAALSDVSPQDRTAMGGLRGFVVFDPADYYAVPLPAPPP